MNPLKLMTYNIWLGGEDRLAKIIELVNAEKPDVLVINEAHGWDAEQAARAREFGTAVNLPNWAFAKSGEGEYHVVLLSRFGFAHSETVPGLQRAGLLGVLKTGDGEVPVMGVHLTPMTDEQRTAEVQTLLKTLEKYPNAIVLGDCNAEKNAHSMQLLVGAGFVDAGENVPDTTVPTAIRSDFDSAKRFDYIWVRGTLAQHVKNYRVVKNEVSDLASDHYPVVVELG